MTNGVEHLSKIVEIFCYCRWDHCPRGICGGSSRVALVFGGGGGGGGGEVLI